MSLVTTRAGAASSETHPAHRPGAGESKYRQQEGPVSLYQGDSGCLRMKGCLRNTFFLFFARIANKTSFSGAALRDYSLPVAKQHSFSKSVISIPKFGRSYSILLYLLTSFNPKLLSLSDVKSVYS